MVGSTVPNTHVERQSVRVPNKWFDEHMPLATSTPISNTDTPSPPVSYATSSASQAEVERVTESELRTIFGARKLQNWRLLEKVGEHIKVVDDGEPIVTLPDMSSVPRNKANKKADRPTKRLHTVGMDIGYGDGTSPGGYRYALTFVDAATRQSWTYGLKTKTGRDIIDALWAFFIDANGLPHRIRCDFDPSFVKGDVKKFLRRHRIKITASPPGRQSQNGLVERFWRTGIQMARGLLLSAPLPKRFWFWAYREAIHRMNVLPVKRPDGTITTPYELFYKHQPDMRSVLYKWGSLGYYRRPSETSAEAGNCLLYTSPSPRDATLSRMPSSA